MLWLVAFSMTTRKMSHVYCLSTWSVTAQSQKHSPSSNEDLLSVYTDTSDITAGQCVSCLSPSPDLTLFDPFQAGRKLKHIDLPHQVGFA